MIDTNAHPADELGTPVGPQAAAQEALRVEIAGHEPEPGAAPGPEEAQLEEDTWEDLLTLAIGASFEFAASVWGPTMGASEKEVATLVKPWAKVCEKHSGKVIPIEYVAIGATVLMVGPKVVLTIKANKRRKAAPTAEQQHRGATTTHV